MEVVDVEWLLLPILSETKKQEIKNKLPNINSELAWLSGLHQDWLDHLAGPKSKIPVAKVCLLDAVRVTGQTSYALGQAYAHINWFKEECPGAPKNSDAHHYGRFYADDAVIRLYSAAEHVASFIISFLDIPKNELSQYKKENKQVAMAVVIGKYLTKQKANSPITLLLETLRNEKWDFIRGYRNEWIHNKPSMLDSPGVDYKRINRWRQMGNIYSLGLRTNYVPDHALDDLLDATLQCLWGFSKVLSEMTNVYFQEIETLGIKRDLEKGVLIPPDNYWTR